MNMNHKTRNRTGATAVEFAMVAPLFLLVLFICFEFSKMTMVESFAEDAAFTAARHVVVLGASTQESIEEATNTLSLMGIRSAEVTIEPSAGGVVQTEIDDLTDTVAVRISIPMRENLIVAGFLSDYVMEKEAVLSTERF